MIVPALVAVVVTAGADRHRRQLWILTGPLSVASIAWGVAIASTWGLDPVPISAWWADAASLLWPVTWGVLSRRSDRRLLVERA